MHGTENLKLPQVLLHSPRELSKPNSFLLLDSKEILRHVNDVVKTDQ
jgi:hypothetical protein